jgi:preprotein translocase subunit SecE
MTRLAAPFRFIVEYFQGAIAELRHVTWPTRTEIIRYSILVLATIGVGGLVIMALDYGLRTLTERYLIR